MDKYRIETGSIYEWNEEAWAYVHIGKTIQYTKKELRAMEKEQLEIRED